jgi:ADP-ribose pyrophosphatase YjhB (NUDIX family)
LIDPAGLVLLQEVQASEYEGTVWIAPGGGLESGETHEAAALREIGEELGQVPAHLGPCVWVRNHEFDFRGTHYKQSERFFVARVAPFHADTSRMDELELEIVRGHRWWSVDEIDGAITTLFAPRSLGRLLRPLVAGIIPSEPINVGV